LHLKFLNLYFSLPRVIVVVVEVLACVAAFYTAAALRFTRSLDSVVSSYGSLLPRALVFVLFALMAIGSLGLYASRQRSTLLGTLARLAIALAAAMFATSICFYFVPGLYLGRGVLLLATLIAFAICAGTRLMIDRVVGDEIFKRRVLVYGSGRMAGTLLQLRRRVDQRGFRIVGFIRCMEGGSEVPADRIVDPPPNLAAWAIGEEIDEIVVALDDRRGAFPIRELLECRMRGIEVLDLVSFFEREVGRVKIGLLHPAWLIFAGGVRAGRLREVLARTFDIIVSSAMLLVTWPLMVLTAVAITIEDGFAAPIIYRQSRVGLHGEIFDVLKFRSMSVDAEKEGGAVWARRHDPRVTRVGGFIRKVRIDELPQLWNVLRGDMRFVGPRPERPEFVVRLSETIPYYAERHSVKPGLTGWAQLCYPYGSSDADAAEKLEYDLYYVKNRSLLFDIMILLQTVEVVILGKGAR
jgi:sugar transferase (PEP-CTERM system associated)